MPLCRFVDTPTGCTRAHCPFFHPFFHGAPAPAPAVPAAPAGSAAALFWDDVSAPDVSDARAFPALSSAGGAPPAPRAAAPTGSLAARLALDALHRAFPGVPSGALAAALGEAGGSVPRAAALVGARSGVAAVEGALGTQRVAAAAPPAAGGGPGGGPRAAAAARAIARAVERVPTGAGLASLYAAARGEAEALAKVRNEAFDRAAHAHHAGDAAGAARFSAQGRVLDERMVREHRAAAAKIFAARNDGAAPPLEVPLGGGAVLAAHVLDLHGLHASEAAGFVGAALEGWRASRSSVRWAALLTGERSHSQALGKGGGSLHEGLAQHLRGMGGTSVHEPTFAGGLRGVLVVEF